MGRQALALLAMLDAACAGADELQQAAAEEFRKHPDYAIITSFPGLADLTGARMLAEIGDDRTRFAELEGKMEMTVKINRPENLFEGFDHTQYDDEARERWPEEFEQSRRNTATMTAEDVERMQRELTAAMIRMAEFMAAGTPVGDAAVQAEIHTQYQGMCRFWTPNRDAYKCLGQMYVDDERFKANYEKIAEGLAEYQRDVMVVYADERLGE